MARILITSAIPYINGIKHLGNLIGSQLPADLYARYNRLRGNEVMFICATDEHGTPAELAAAKAGKPIEEFCAEMHEIQRTLSEGFSLSFDHFGRSSSDENKKLTQYFAGKLNENGVAKINSNLKVGKNAPGMLNVQFLVRAFENGGDLAKNLFKVYEYCRVQIISVTLKGASDSLKSSIDFIKTILEGWDGMQRASQ